MKLWVEGIGVFGCVGEGIFIMNRYFGIEVVFVDRVWRKWRGLCGVELVDVWGWCSWGVWGG